MSELKISEDSKVNLCDGCIMRSNMPLCTPDEEGIDFKFGDGEGHDNIIGCVNYDGNHFDD